MDDSALVFLSLIMIVAGLYFGYLWISAIFTIVLFTAILTQKGEKAETFAGPKVRPIIIKRKYVGPESIYPKEMKIKVSTKDYGTGTPIYVEAAKGAGFSIGKFLKSIFR